MSRNVYVILVLLLAVSALVNLLRPGGLMAYLFPIICWGLLALATLKVCGFERIRSWFNKRVFVMAALIGVFQLVALIDTGLVTGFGISTQTFTPRGLLITSIYAFAPLLGMELSRAYLLKTVGKKKPFLTLGLVTLLYSFITMSIVGLIAIITSNDPLLTSKFMGSTFLPIVTENLLASYLALLAGPIASLAYRAPLVAFEWFFPVLPDLTWGFESIIGVLAPTIGFIVISQMTTLKTLRKAGVKAKLKPKRFLRRVKGKKSSSRVLTIMSLICVLTVWGTTGLVGLYSTVVITGSMRPTMEVGDIAIVTETAPEAIQIGDIIQYWQEGEMIIHRVTDIRPEGGIRFFQTKGDANPTPDTELIHPTQIKGKLIFTIPKLGWASIAIKTAIINIWSFLSTNIILTYTIIVAVTPASIYSLYRKHQVKRLRGFTRRRDWLR